MTESTIPESQKNKEIMVAHVNRVVLKGNEMRQKCVENILHEAQRETIAGHMIELVIGRIELISYQRIKLDVEGPQTGGVTDQTQFHIMNLRTDMILLNPMICKRMISTLAASMLDQISYSMLMLGVKLMGDIGFFSKWVIKLQLEVLTISFIMWVS